MLDRKDQAVDRLGDKIAAAVDDDHCAVFQIADALVGLFAVALDLDSELFSGAHQGL